MAEATWNFSVDLNGDGDFSDTGEDISVYIISADWQIGFAKAFDTISRDNTMTLVLKNSDNRFSPEHASALAGFTRGRVIRVQMTYAATTKTLFIGWIGEISPAAGTKERRTTTVTVEGYWARAQKAEAFVPLQESKTADQVIEAILANTFIYPPGFTGRWLLGVVGFSELGVNTILGATSDYLSAEVGKTTFAYIADKWGDGVSVYGALADTVGREYGRLFLDRSGVIVFWNRHHLILATVVAATFSNSMMGLDYKYGSNIVNVATVQANPRKVSISPETLGTIDGSTKIEPSSTKTVTFRYASQTAGEKIAGRNAIAPVQTTDFAANSASDGSGTDYTSSVTAAITTETATQCIVAFANAATVAVYVQSGAKIRGTKITDYGTVAQTSQDDTSIASYGRQAFTYPSTMDNTTDAQGVAEYVVTSRKDARGDIAAVSLLPRANATLMAQARDRTIGDRITLTETQTGVATKDYFIIGEHHILMNAGKDYSLAWNIEPASGQQYWVLGITGYSELGVTTYAGPL